MFLKRLDVAGFKSFAERVSIDFVPGVTAVVGPNGSGKSNITDAIRWVLGEQSAKSLRGGKMEDVIFSGSDARKSLNVAEVTLTLDNGDGALPLDYAEISVTRRVYRSGDSDYLINNQSCRLKDIVELFMDSGLGKEAFSIIGQGRVEQILNSKPEERRIIIEEAAGVLKYKNRRKKAEAKLLETQENLYRVQDILHELQGQIEPLRMQASIAKDYLEKKADLENTEVAVLVHDIESLSEEWEQAKQNYTHIVRQEEEKQAEISVEEAKLAEVRNRLTELDQTLAEKQQQLLSVTEASEQLEGRRQVLVERKKNAHQNEEQMKQAATELEQEIHSLTTLAKSNESKTAISNEALLKLAADIAHCQKELDLIGEDLEEKLEQMKNDYFDLLTEQTSKRNDLRYTEDQLNQQSQRASKLVGQNSHLIEQRDEAKARKERLQAEVAKVLTSIESLSSQYKQQVDELSRHSGIIEQLESQLYKAYQYVNQAKSRKEALESLEDDFSGFYQGVKEVLKARGTVLKGIEGAVAELIQVDGKYETAIETALGGSMQSVVTATEQDARQAIQFLKKNRYGRATFLPMSVMKGKSLQSSQLATAKEHPGFVDVASSLVTFDDRHRSIVENLLGTVLIVTDLKSANELAARLHYRFRFVTTDGDVVNPGGSMTGGAQTKKNNSLLSRKNELDQLTKQLPEMETTTRQLEEKIRAGKMKRKELETAVESTRSKGESMRIQESDLKASLREAETTVSQVSDRLALYDLEMGEFSSSETTLQTRKDELENAILELQQKIDACNEKMTQLTENRKTQRDSKDAITTRLYQLQSDYAVTNEKHEQLKRDGEQLKQQLAQATKKHRSIQEDLVWLSEEQTTGEDHAEQLTKAIEEKHHERSAIHQAIDTAQQERKEMLGRQEALDQIVREYKRLQKGLIQAISDADIKQNRIEVELDAKLNRLEEEYELTFNGAKLQYPLTQPVEDARRQVKLIKLSIEELGSVNIGAIEEYERVSERYDFLIEQQTDLQEARSTLQDVIAEMDMEMSRRFGETFDQIKKHFSVVFKELFGGGKAELLLTDPKDLLNAGVDIIAQPPGKKLQNLGLLSGGERALTAIALLFAILKVRPVPFCILDEVEAALDEANVHRFSQYLHRFSAQSQFIVITHRKGTMEGADVLYGVTMQESGVSKLVSVRLEEYEEVPQKGKMTT